jgi:hypothetical protein
MHSTPIGRARAHDALAKRGYELPAEVRNAPPLVTWFHAGCRRRVLRLYLTPNGWFMLSERFSLPLDQWLDRVGLSRAEYEAGVVTDAGRVNGHQRTLPLTTSDWPQGEFEIGCSRHLIGRLPLADLASDADTARVTRRAIRRSVSAGTSNMNNKL